MTFFENIKLALTSLRANMMRSILTMLGIIIGIASVIAIMTVGDGMTASINDSLSNLGATNVTVYIQPKVTDDNRFTAVVMDEEDYLTDEMIDALKEKYSDEIQAVSLESSVGGGTIYQGSEEGSVSVTGINLDYLNTNDIKIVSGRMLVDRDIDGARNVAMISDKLADKLFGDNYNDIIGKEITVEGYNDFNDFTVVGVYKYVSNIPVMMINEENITTSVYIPISTAKYINGEDLGYSSFEIKSEIGVDGLTFSEEVKDFLNHYYEGNENYEVNTFSMESMIEEMNTMLGMVQLALSVIAGISLLVGGIGVMNIMLVSVSERTKEIGTRKAMGATNRNIRMQFVTESIIVCMIGGFIGILLGGSLGYTLSSYIGAASLPTVTSIMISFGFSLAIGVFFGYYPANRAALLNPIDALRYE